MRVLLFTIYYVRLRIGSYLGTHPTHGPLGIKWRWETWRRLRKAERKYAAAGTISQMRSDLARLWKTIVN
ncbi:MAG: hypothetical protein AB7F88_03930 [Pyrinomonadaceae bacterium]